MEISRPWSPSNRTRIWWISLKNTIAFTVARSERFCRLLSTCRHDLAAAICHRSRHSPSWLLFLRLGIVCLRRRIFSVDSVWKRENILVTVTAVFTSETPSSSGINVDGENQIPFFWKIIVRKRKENWIMCCLWRVKKNISEIRGRWTDGEEDGIFLPAGYQTVNFAVKIYGKRTTLVFLRYVVCCDRSRRETCRSLTRVHVCVV